MHDQGHLTPANCELPPEARRQQTCAVIAVLILKVQRQDQKSHIQDKVLQFNCSNISRSSLKLKNEVT